MSKNLRFWTNNCVNLDKFDQGRLTFSSEAPSFPGSNVANPARSKLWKPNGNFEIDSSNRVLYVNDGTDLDIFINEGAYTGTSLATALQVALNSASSNWTVTYNPDLTFTFDNTSSVTMRFSEQSIAIWDTLGFTTTTDQSGISFTSQEERNHTSEWVQLDMGVALSFNSVAMIGPIDVPLSITSAGILKIEANNVDDWVSPPLSQTIPVQDRGAFLFFNDAGESYRYWRLVLVDPKNPGGPTGLEVGNVYIGDYETTTQTNVASGFSVTHVDPSKANESERGNRFFEKRTKYHRLDNMSYDVLFEDDRLLLEDIFSRFCTTEPFYVSIDPSAAVSPDLEAFTYYVYFNKEPVFQNLFRDKWTMKMSLREAV